MTFPVEIVSTILGIVSAALGWWMRDLWEAHKELRDDLSKFKETVPKEYVLKSDLRSDLDEIKMGIRDIAVKIDKKQDRV